MPLYPFCSPTDPSVTTDLLFSMNSAPSVGKIITVDGVKWRRLVSKPQASFDTKADPNSVDDFLKVTNKKNTIGDMFDRSKELSMKRVDKEGVDTVKAGYLKDYTKRRRGKIHPEQLRMESTTSLAKKGIKIDWGSDD